MKTATATNLAVFACATALAGCGWIGDTIEPAYLINRSGQSVTVRVSMSFRKVGEDPVSTTCPLERNSEPLQIASAHAVYEKNADEWQPAPLTAINREECVATILLPNDWALLMFRNGTCSDDVKHLSDPRYVPTVKRLDITADGISVALTGSDTAKAFKASRLRHDCRLTIGSPG
jgi:hypothetical protein